MGWLNKLFGGGASTSPLLRQDTVKIKAGLDLLRVEWRVGSYPLEVVGESHYQPALEKLCGGHNRYGHEVERHSHRTIPTASL